MTQPTHSSNGFNLRRIEINGFRSIRACELDLRPLDDESSTFALIGVNEAGKSSVLHAIMATLGGKTPSKKDFQRTGDIVVKLSYEVSPTAVLAWMERADMPFKTVTALATADAHESVKSTEEETEIDEEVQAFANGMTENSRLTSPVPFELIFQISRTGVPQISARSKNLRRVTDLLLKLDQLPLSKFPQRAVFWESDERYLISRPIPLRTFASSPEETSIPLTNCFRLAGIEDIESAISALDEDAAEVHALKKSLGTAVTEHIRSAWPNHPIEIQFEITGDLEMSFLVLDKDDGGKAKVVSQRSDGFRQFVSFLLTVSAQRKNQQLWDTILLIDEPETHLHPMGQEYLLSELVKTTSSANGNVCLFATHTSHMIDKDRLARNFKVTKDGGETAITRFENKHSSYAGVVYEVFGIVTPDYFCELYGELQMKFADFLGKETVSQIELDEKFFQEKQNLAPDRPWKDATKQVTFPTYIRNCIHHRENADYEYTKDDLLKAINQLRRMR